MKVRMGGEMKVGMKIGGERIYIYVTVHGKRMHKGLRNVFRKTREKLFITSCLVWLPCDDYSLGNDITR